MKNELQLTLEEIQIIDNELYVAQCKLSRLNKFSLDNKAQEYRRKMSLLRIKVGQFLETTARNRFINNYKI